MQFSSDDELAPGVARELQRRGLQPPTIHERDAVICWGWQDTPEGEERAGNWSDMRVFDVNLVGTGMGSADARIYAASTFTGGANESGWLGNSGRTCQGRFSQALYSGDVPSHKAYIDVLIQFAKVHECDWARFMLAALHASSIMDIEADDLIEPGAGR